MSLLRVHNFSISLDGFGTGAGQSRDAHFGHAGDRLHEWMLATRWWNRRKRIGSGGIRQLKQVLAVEHRPATRATCGPPPFAHSSNAIATAEALSGMTRWLVSFLLRRTCQPLDEVDIAATNVLHRH